MNKDIIKAMKYLLTQRNRVAILASSVEIKEMIIKEVIDMGAILGLHIHQASHGMLIFPDIESRIIVLTDSPETIEVNEENGIFRIYE